MPEAGPQTWRRDDCSERDAPTLGDESGGGGKSLPAAARAHDQIAPSIPSVPLRKTPHWRDRLSQRLSALDLAPDLGRGIGSPRWLRGVGTLIGLSSAAIAFWPTFGPLEAAPLRLSEAERDVYRSQTLTPLALGAETGSRMGATALARPLAAAPERPRIELVATLAAGDSFERMLRRAGVGAGDAQRIVTLVGGAMPLSDIEAGTQVDIVLGRRLGADSPRPLEELRFRARFDLELAVGRTDGNALSLSREAIRVDDTPLRIRGTIGSSLYRSARAAGAPASAVQAYLKALGEQVDVTSDLSADDTFDIILSHRRAATGERQAGQLLYAGIERGDKPRVQLMRWGSEGRFFEASGVGEQRSGLVAPVPGPMSSSFGMRRHPILGYKRMHSGVDFRARSGTPIVAVTDGQVTGAGRMGGCGQAVRLRHGGGMDTRYCHMSRIAVSSGQSVRRGQVIGYVGSTGLSPGPHLHYEMYRSGRAIDPASVRFVTRAQLAGAELARFRETLAKLKTVEPGAALAALEPTATERAAAAPVREIDRLEAPKPAQAP